MKTKILFGGLFAALAMSFALFSPVKPATADDTPVAKKAYHTGRVVPENLKAIHEDAKKRVGNRVAQLPRVRPLKYSCIDIGIVPPIVDQGQCGSCWDFSGTGIITSALIKAGFAKADGSFMISTQYVLDCGQNGGCNGDDNTTVLAMALKDGLPTARDYGPYRAAPQRCQFKQGTKLYKILDWGFCTPNQQQGVASTQDIKNAMVAYGPIGCAVAADDAFMNNRAGTVFTDSGSQDINHDVILVGWDDSKGRNGAWLMRNSWGTSWCDRGYMWMEYGANQIGTEAVWCTAGHPPTPPPPQPGPTPNTGNPVVSLTITYKDGTTQVVNVHSDAADDIRRSVEEKIKPCCGRAVKKACACGCGKEDCTCGCKKK